MGRGAVPTGLLTLQAAVQGCHVEDTQHAHTSVLKHFASNSDSSQQFTQVYQSHHKEIAQQTV